MHIQLQLQQADLHAGPPERMNVSTSGLGRLQFSGEQRDAKTDEPFTCLADKCSPSHRFLCPLQCSIQANFLNFVTKFQWFKYLLFIKNLVVHIKYNCTHTTI